MLFGGSDLSDLEVRRRSGGGRSVTGRFAYNKRAVLSDGGRAGRPRKESFASRAFSYRVEDEKAEIHLLAGHSYDRPLASRKAGTLTLTDGDDALTFKAEIVPEIADTQHGADALRMLDAGLATGISPGFRLPPERAVPRAEAETITEEPDRPTEGMHRAIIRVIRQALLFELSIVTVPAYGDDAQVEARNWTPDAALKTPTMTMHGALRWR